MKNIKTATLGKILKWSLIFIFVLGIFITPFCHFMLDIFYSNMKDVNTFNETYMTVARVVSAAPTATPEYYAIIFEIYTLGVVMLIIVWQLIKICRSIENDNTFTYATSTALKRIAVAAFALVIIYTLKFVVFPRLPGLMIVFAFVIVGMISSVFSQLFKKAVEYKEENDGTI
jgi:hypothetical protein